MHPTASQIAARLIKFVPTRGRAQYFSNAAGSTLTKDRAKAQRFTAKEAEALLSRLNGGGACHCFSCFADL